MCATDPFSANARRCFTLIELIVIGATLLLVCLVLIPTAWHRRTEVCRNNLKNIGVAFRIAPFQDFVTHDSVQFGGTAELVNTGHAFVHFQVMSNELGDAKRLTCPLDDKLPAKNFGAGFCESNVSYFVGGDATEVLPQAFLSGDRNVTVSNVPVTPGLLVLTTNTILGWSKTIHHLSGYVLLGDGSAQYYDNSLLLLAVRNQGLETNRLCVP